jgi:hypothetical protein
MDLTVEAPDLSKPTASRFMNPFMRISLLGPPKAPDFGAFARVADEARTRDTQLGKTQDTG